MSERLTWEQIKQRYDQEWVELVDFDWPEEEPNPRSGVVRAHNKSHDALFDHLAELERVDLDAVVFVGKVKSTSILRTYNTVTISGDA